MVRKAVVIVPSEEDYKARLEAQEKAETKDVPDNAVMEMKGTSYNTTVSKTVALFLFSLLEQFGIFKRYETPSFN